MCVCPEGIPFDSLIIYISYKITFDLNRRL